jgi:hypothetical protein
MIITFVGKVSQSASEALCRYAMCAPSGDQSGVASR